MSSKNKLDINQPNLRELNSTKIKIMIVLMEEMMITKS